ncbi:hypothetical protein Glove_41g97 [Diversispora epigaea]|uniref:Uncharacterized protein n=1 Tax=Diversispora epigaea TaxID=1348612 RepID=A0A397JF64_9GLOM|nr:hypothetical protein Glove_41g97 [Diversispora epigaea]
MKTLVNLNERDFIIEVFETTSEYGSMPGYICKCDGIQSELYQTLTVAICSVYKRIFGTETKFSGPAVMGFDTPTISNVLLQDLQFRPYFFSLDKLRIWIMSVGKSNKSEWNLAEEPQTQHFIQILHIPSCTLNDWNDGDLMESIFAYHFKCRISTCINWQEFFNQWLIGLSTIIELKTQLKKLYPSNHEINAREFRAWKAMLRNVGCEEITPFEKDQSQVEFWSRSLTPEIDKTNLEILYRQGFLIPIPSYLKNDTKIFWNSFRESLDVNKCGLEGRTQILSIIGGSFTYDEIKKNLEVSNDAIRYARKHAHLYGVGGKAFKKPIITHENFSEETQQQLQAFLLDKAHVVMSSYKTDPVTNEPVHYLKHTKETLWKKYHEQYSDGMQRTSFFTRLQGKKYIYREDLGDNLKRFLKRDYENHFHVTKSGMTFHNPYINHCLLYAFGNCTENHNQTCNECQELFSLFENIRSYIDSTNYEELEDLKNHLLYYLAHQTRKVYLNAQFNANLLELDEKTALILVDYKMKILLKTARETKNDWFGKKGWSLHTVMVYRKQNSSSVLQVQAYNYWSADTRQDSWFTASSLHAVIENLNPKPESIIVMSDNGGHYHNADLMMIMSFWPEWYNIEVKKWIFLEAGEAKTSIDSHHAQISHAINRYVRLGFDIQTGQDIENAIKGIRGTSVAHLQPNRDRGTGNNILPGNSNWFEWQWQTTGDLDGCILARAVPNIGDWIIFTPAQLKKLQNREIETPKPLSSNHTIPSTSWEVPIPNSERFDIQTGQDIENAIKGIRGTSVAHLQPNRDRGTGNNILPGNSNWFEWQWQTTGDLDGCILARAVPNIGDWIIFTPAQLKKLQNREIETPKPLSSNHTIPSTSWEVPIPNSEHIRTDCLSKEKLIKHLQFKGIEINEKENKVELIKKLEIELNKDNICVRSDNGHNVLVDITNQKAQQNLSSTSNYKEFPLQSGWALKQNQKFGKKGAGKRMSIHGEIDNEEVPKVGTIQNWINKMTRVHREQAAARVLESSNT